MTKEISIRVADDSEIERARDILRAAYAQYESEIPPENWQLYSADILDLEARAAASELLVAELDGAIVSCVSYYPPGAEVAYPSQTFSETWPGDWAAFRLLAVDPSAQGKGVGRAVTEACIERARAAGAPALGLHTTEPMSVARAMYERMGFERVPRYDFQPAPEVLVEAYRLMFDSSPG